MRMQRNFYEVLGVARNATKQEIKEKYYQLARKYHPDRAQDKVLADKMFVQINRAYSTLFNEAKREKYDAGLDAMGALPTRPAGGPISRQSPQSQPVPDQVTSQHIREWFDKASQLQMRGEFSDAIATVKKVIDADPSHFSGLILMGDLLSQTGKPADAVQVYERALAQQPANRLVRDKMARLQSVLARAAANPTKTPPPSSNAVTPPSGTQRPAAAQAPAAPPKPPVAKPQPKSLFDRLINRK